MMADERIRIEGPPEILLELSERIAGEAGDEVEVEPITKAVPGELGEPTLVALIIGPSGVAALGHVVKLLSRTMTHMERKELLQIFRERDREPISVKELEELS
jgi:hypothetical protein